MRRFALLCLLAGCAQAPEPLAEPLRPVSVSYRRAPWLDGLFGHAGGEAPAAAASCTVHAAVFAVRGEPLGIPVQDVATTIAAAEGTPFRGATATLRAVRHLAGDDATAWAAAAGKRPATELQRLGEATAVVACELATEFHGKHGQPDVLATLRGDRVLLALRNADEILVLATTLAAAGDAVVLLVPAAAPGLPLHAVLLERRGEVDPAALGAAIAAADEDLARRREPAGDRSAERQVELARQAVGERNRRPALLGIAQRLRTPRVVDVLLCADEAALRAIAADLPAPPAADAGPSDRWQFERHVWLALLPQLQRDELPPALRACVLRHLGAVLYDPTTLGLLLQASPAEAEFLEALREENLLSLADHDAAPRVRAHEWLAGCGGSVPGFDPLGPLADRQVVLRTFHASAAAKAATERAQEAGR